MGIVIDYKCICGYKERIFEGAGFRAMNMELISKHFPDEGKFISEHRGEIKPYLIKNVLGECVRCKKLYSTAHLEYTHDGKTYIKLGNCPYCNETIKMIENTKEVKCPICDNIMEHTHIGHWD